MFKESVVKSNRPVVMIGIIIIIGLILFTLPEYFNLGKYRLYLELGILILMIIGIIINIRFRLSKFTIMFIGDEVIVRSTSHKKNKVIIIVNVRDIITIIKRNDKQFSKYKRYYHLRRFCETNNKQDDIIVVYKKGKINSYLAFEPSDKFLDMLYSRTKTELKENKSDKEVISND